MENNETDPVTGFVPPHEQTVRDNKDTRRSRKKLVMVPASWEYDLDKPVKLPENWSDNDENYSSSDSDQINFQDRSLSPGSASRMYALKKLQKRIPGFVLPEGPACDTDRPTRKGRRNGFLFGSGKKRVNVGDAALDPVKAMDARLKHRTHEDSGCVIPPFYNLLENFKEDCGPRYGYPVIEKLAFMAIDDYNSHERTKYKFVDVVKVGWKLANELRYYIIFQAKDSDQLDTFEAEVCSRKLKMRMYVYMVLGVRISGPQGFWIDGTLQELV